MPDLLTPSGAAPPAPAQGAPAIPVVVSAGVLATIPPPTAATPTGPQPIPWTRGWVVILNSSPYTLLVTSGGPVTQIAAFTSDKVFVLTTGTPVTVLPQPGSSAAVGGSDSTVYATWYHDEPPGTYPAALGSGSANLQPAAAVVSSVGGTNLPAFSNAVFPGGFNTFKSSGFGGIRVYFNNFGNGVLQLVIRWYGQAATIPSVVGERKVLASGLGAAGGFRPARFGTPHQSDFFDVSVRNGGAVAQTYDLIVTQAASDQPWWAGETQQLAGSAGLFNVFNLAQATQLVPPASVVTFAPDVIYAGPVSMSAIGLSAGTGNVYVLAMDTTGAFQYIYGFNMFSTGASIVPQQQMQVILPPTVVQFQLQNTSAGGVQFNFGATADEYR